MTDLPPAILEVPAQAVAHLRQSDPHMAALVDRVGELHIPVEPDLWRSLVGAIVGQQLSVAAARTIRGRIAALGQAEFPAPEEILELSDETLRGAGLSRAKVIYVRDLAAHWIAGELNPAEIRDLPDEAVIERLVRVKGIGRWTAEMVLLFSLARPDVLAVDDLGLRIGAQRAYGLAERPSAAELIRLGEPWRPYRSYASLFLWRAHDG